MNFLLLIVHAISHALIVCQDDVETTTESEDFCRERNRLIGTNKDDLYKVVEVTLGEKIMLECHYCGENDDSHPKNWFKLDPLNNTVEYEVQLGIENNMTLNRVHVNPEHTLTIHNVTYIDSGEYFCEGLDDLETENKYNFLVDVIVKNDVPFEKGNASSWRTYHDNFLVPINKLLNASRGPEYDYLMYDLRVHLQLVTEWEPLGPCEICGKPKGEGTQSRKGLCKFKITPFPFSEVKANNFYEKMMLRATHLSCRSMTVQKLIPGIVNMTELIPEYIEIERCDGTCNPDAEGIYKGWKTNKKSGYKYRKTFVLAENAHLTLICPESTLDNVVVWKADGRVIKPGHSVETIASNEEPRVTVDTFNTLYLYGVTKEEEGNYTCYVDKIRMQNVRVFVVSKARLLTQAFVRHMMYLAFVLSLTSSCYCVGLVVTFTRRKKFKSFQEIRDQLKIRNEDSDIEKGGKKKVPEVKEEIPEQKDIVREDKKEPEKEPSVTIEEEKQSVATVEPLSRMNVESGYSIADDNERNTLYKHLIYNVKAKKYRPYKRVPIEQPSKTQTYATSSRSSSPEIDDNYESSSEISLLEQSAPETQTLLRQSQPSTSKSKKIKVKKCVRLNLMPQTRTRTDSSSNSHPTQPRRNRKRR